MSRRTKIIIAALVILLLLLLALLLLFPKPTETPTANEPAPAAVNAPSGGLAVNSPRFNVNVSVPVTNTPAEPPKIVDERAGLKVVAKSFSELFGSYSTEGDFQNIVDAEFYMTDAVKEWAERYVTEHREMPKAEAFNGTTTRAIFDPKIDAYDKDSGTATVTVKTRRIESGTSVGTENVYYQDLTLDMSRAGDTWKVSKFTWGPK